MDQYITPHFSLSELTYSRTARKMGIDNTPTPLVIDHLIYMCVNLLEPIRKKIGTPVLVTSGYRCAELNKAIGGSSRSEHVYGSAVDIKCFGITDDLMFARLIEEIPDLTFNQFILEYYHPKENNSWIHISCKTGGNKKQKLVIDKEGRRETDSFNDLVY